MGAYETKVYRNVFEQLGKTPEEIEKKIQDAAHTFFTAARRSGSTIRWEKIWGIWRIPGTMMPERKGCPTA